MMGSPLDQFIKYWLPLFLFFAVHFVLSHIPGDQYPEMGSSVPSLLAHAMIFALIGLLGQRAAAKQFLKVGNPFWISVGVFALGYIWGVSDEIHQEFFVAHRGYEFHDLVMNSIGLVIGIRSWYVMFKMNASSPNRIIRNFL